jgi:transcriptional regulator with XRE-family HTH domain
MWGIKIKNLLKQHSMSQKELSAATKTPESSVSIWINQTYPPLDFIEKVCIYFEIPMWQFFAPEDASIPSWVMPEDIEMLKALYALDKETRLEIRRAWIDGLKGIINAMERAKKA